MDFSQPDQPNQYEPIGPGSSSRAGSGAEISEGPCDQCGQGPASIQRYMWVMSFLVMTRHLEYAANLCRACSTRTGLKEQAKSALLGWWGVPWGLMTFKALWINARTLSRWSTLPAALALLTFLAGFVAPAAVGYWAYLDSAEERQAKKTGDWLDEDVIALLEEGHEHYNSGRLEQAVASYEAAYEKAPRSSAVSSSLAQTLIDLGELEQALPYAATAAELDPDTPSWTAMHGWLLARLQGPEAARVQVATLRAVAPEDAVDAIWMADLFDEVGAYDQQLRVARAGLVFEPASPYLAARELAALVELDRLDEAGAMASGLDEEALEVSYLAYARDIYRMRTQPSAETERLCARWADTGYTEGGMAGFVRAADRAGRLDQVRSQIRDWLDDPETPGDAWGSAEPWFTDTWTEELDRYLAKRPEPFPAFLRLQLYDPLTEAASIRRLASRVEASDHPLAQYVDLYLYSYGAGAESYARRAERLEEHLETAPDHVVCRSLLAGYLARSAPERAAAHLRVLDEAAQDDPSLVATNAVDRAHMQMALGAFDDALATASGIDPEGSYSLLGPSSIDLTTAEAAFLAGDVRVLQERLRRLVQGNGGRGHAAGLVIRWCQEAAAGAPSTYRADVDQFLARYGDDLLAEQSSSAQSILVAEGRVDRAERKALLTPEDRVTLELVEVFRDADRTGSLDEEALARVAHSRYPNAFAPLLARTAFERRTRRNDA